MPSLGDEADALMDSAASRRRELELGARDRYERWCALVDPYVREFAAEAQHRGIPPVVTKPRRRFLLAREPSRAYWVVRVPAIAPNPDREVTAYVLVNTDGTWERPDASEWVRYYGQPSVTDRHVQDAFVSALTARRH